MGERNGDARTFWLELQDDGKVDFMFEKTQDVLQSLKKKIKDGSATNKVLFISDYVQAMILVNEATIRNSATKDHIPVTQTEQEHRSNACPSASCENFPEDCTTLSPGQKALLPANSKAADLGEKECPLSVSFQSHICSSACLMETPLSLKGENPLQRPIRCHFQRRHAKTNSHSSALHVNYKTPCGRSLRNMEEVFHYLIETECTFLFTDNFSFNTYVQLTRNHPKQDEVVSAVDISNGMEPVPISFCNEVDSRKLPQFKYRRTVWPRACYLNSSSMFSVSCDCSEGCIDVQKCACLQLTAKNAKACSLSPDGVYTGYNYKRLQRLIPTGIYECNLLCKCSRWLCQNRVVQHGPQVRLQVFKSEKKGWGVRCLDDIDRGTFVCIYSGRLLSRATPEKTNTDKNRREQQNHMENELSKKRKIEVACSDCETQPSSPKTEQCSLKSISDLREPVIEMNCRNISKTQRHSVIRSPKSKTTIFHCNEKDMGFVSSESTTPEDENGFKPAPEHLNSKARAHEDLSSNQVGYSEDGQLVESDVIDTTRSREDTSPEGRWKHVATVNNEKTEKVLEVPVKSREEGPASSHSQPGFCDEELPNERTKTLSPSVMSLGKENVFLLDASKEGNVGRFLNHSCSPNLCVQNVFVETHDRNFPLVAFFTNRYVKARTELTWDYGYEAGTVPEKEILCQCGVNKCRKKII
ncbi:histone-lysine N-methyltransferase SETDB2 isoform X1 [Microtus pennsylvanicus]|uniref:histone-lysine N-methyltransferase SETDB2 isoform X1 n=1 Tax=Microtus pennsylvanicus TaxID=10058 RepID=UPI003F6D5294